MKVADVLLVAMVASLATFVAVQSDAHRAGSAASDAPLVFDGRVSSSAPGDVGDAVPHTTAGALAAGPLEERTSGPPIFVPDVPRLEAWPAAELRRRLQQGESGTYIGALLHARDSVITRWPDRVLTPLRVWVGDGGAFEGWDPLFPRTVREAFDEWAETGIPVRFTYVRDSATADVHVRFVESFAQGISGRTIWSRDDAWWLVGGDIELALLHPRGDPVTAAQLRSIALHEIGHLLGLDHVDDPTHIMAPRVRARALSEADRATVRLLYSVPAGSTRDDRDTPR
jgi:hypothetical protein